MKGRYARWRKHGAPGWLMVYTLGGKGRFSHSSGTRIVTPGDLILLQPGTPNDYGLEETLKRWDLLWAYFFPKQDWLPLLKWPEEFPGFARIHLPKGDLCKMIVKQLNETNRFNSGPLRLCEKFALNALEQVLLLCDSLNPSLQTPQLDDRILTALHYLCENSSKPITIPMLAKQSGLSISRLSHLFKEQVGQTPREFLETQRITHACRFLEYSDTPISAIAEQIGYEDPFHFSHRFKKRMGMSPRAWRLQYCPA